MNITRQHYEEYFLLYVDNELNETERKAVENFVQQNPDLQQELIALQQSVVRPDQHLSFDGKASLLKQEPISGLVNESNYEEYFILYGDDELSYEQKEQVEQFVYKHPQYEAEFELVLQARLEPDTLIGFPDKKSLYRSEKERRIPVIRWWYAAAAVLTGLFLVGLTWTFLTPDKTNSPKTAVAVTDKKDSGTKTPQTAGIDQRDTSESPVANDKKEQQAMPQTSAIADVDTQPAKNTSPNKQPVIASNNKQVAKSPVTQRAAPVANDLASATAKKENPLTSKVQQSEKKLPEISNTLTSSSVTLQEATVKQEVKAGTTQIDVKGSGSMALAMANSQKTAATDKLTMATDDEPEYDPFTTAPNKKNRMRGLFRKVSRVFERATNLEPAENNKGAIRIANFEIALK